MPPRSQRLEQASLALFTQHPDGIMEYRLLKRLREEPYAPFPRWQRGANLGLFQSHFLLLRPPYILRDWLYAERQADHH